MRHLPLVPDVAMREQNVLNGMPAVRRGDLTGPKPGSQAVGSSSVLTKTVEECRLPWSFGMVKGLRWRKSDSSRARQLSACQRASPRVPRRLHETNDTKSAPSRCATTLSHSHRTTRQMGFQAVEASLVSHWPQSVSPWRGTQGWQRRIKSGYHGREPPHHCQPSRPWT